MTTRRTFVAGSLAAAAALALPVSARAEARSARIRTRDSTELHVKEWGASGRTVIFTHAWPLSADIWGYQAAALAEAGHHVIAYDRRGFGRSSQPTAGYDFDTLSDDLAAVIAETGARDITLVGYSMGGGEVVRYFSRHGGKQVAKAALVGAAFDRAWAPLGAPPCLLQLGALTTPPRVATASHPAIGWWPYCGASHTRTGGTGQYPPEAAETPRPR